MNSYQKALNIHYNTFWKSVANVKRWGKGEMNNFFPDFFILEFPPYPGRDMWTYATNGMSKGNDGRVELHIFSDKKDYSLVELLTAIAYYSLTSSQVKLGDTVNFGKPWQGNSACSYGFVSLPYLDGPKLEKIREYSTRCCWLIPITQREREFKIKFGVEALEQKFDDFLLNYIDENRKSVV